MFAYCGNNPINCADNSGYFWHVVVGAGIGAIANGLLTILDNVTDGDPDTAWNDGVGLSLITGAISGGFAVSACGPAVQMAVNSVVTAVEELPEVAQKLHEGENVFATLGGYVFDIGLSAITSNSSGLGSKHAANLGKQTIKRTWNAFTYEGLAAGFSEMGKAAQWYLKSARTLIGSYSKDQIKDAIKSAG